MNEKTIVIVYDQDSIAKGDASKLVGLLTMRGFDPILLPAEDSQPLRIFDLSHLPPAELEALRGLLVQPVTPLTDWAQSVLRRGMDLIRKAWIAGYPDVERGTLSRESDVLSRMRAETDKLMTRNGVTL